MGAPKPGFVKWAQKAAAVLLLLPVPPLHAAPRRYTVDASRSEVVVAVGRAGLFKFAGHGHEVLSRAFAGFVIADPADLSGSSVSLTFEAPALEVSGKGEPPEDVAKVQEKMAGSEVLDVSRFPAIAFASRRVTGQATADGAWKLEVTGELSLRGTTRTLTFPVRVELAGDLLTASAAVELKQTDFGIQPVSVAGVVKVKNELGVSLRIVAKASP